MNPISIHHRRFDLLVWVLCCLLAGATLLIYVGAGTAGGRGELIMPLDDVYIHFQYARQMAAGEPYIYNPGGVATSGATSFLYPYVLAGGYLLGFRDLNLGLWAMGVGALALLGSMWTVYLLLRDFPAPRWLASAAALIFGVTGSIAWHFMSGMETGLMVLFLLFTLYMFIHHQYTGFVISTVLLALIRPEGSVLAVLAVGLWGVRSNLPHPPTPSPFHGEGGQKTSEGVFKRTLYWKLGIPVVACVVQPLVNLLLTGSAQASGSAAKSILNTIPHDWGVILPRILNNFIRMWGELFTGYSPREGWYVFPVLMALAFVGLFALLRQHGGRFTALLVIAWLLALMGAVSTLDTAFWHFKRYQIPVMGLFVPLAGCGAAWLWSAFAVHPQRRRALRVLALGVVGFGVLFSLLIAAQFVGYFHTNVGYVYAQPYQMALWLRANTPQDAVVAVHDVGMMRYVGGRTTLDMVGLTTPGAAEYWRNGPGSVAEFLIDQQPDYIASYGEGHGYGLGMLAQTSLFANERAYFEVVLDDRVNVALAATGQGIYQPAWEEMASADGWTISSEANPMLAVSNMPAFRFYLGGVDVAEVRSEDFNQYSWTTHGMQVGFPSELHEFSYLNCDPLLCRLLDGGRLINGDEEFTLFVAVDSGNEMPSTSYHMLITRVHPETNGYIDIYVNDVYIDRRWIPAMPGHWLDLVIPEIPLESKDNKLQARVRIVPYMESGFYRPYHHALFSYRTETEINILPETRASYQQGKFTLLDAHFELASADNVLNLALDWHTDGSAEGDYRQFVHLYDDIAQPPIAQWDGYPGNGTLPPGNWLPGVLTDRIALSLSGVVSGTYRLAIGFYNPYTQERLMPTSDVYEVSADGRLWLGEVEIP